jgi:hypothetical protein
MIARLAGERSRTVVSALAWLHSAVEPHPHRTFKPLAGLFHRLTPGSFRKSLSGKERAGPLDLLRVQGLKWWARRDLHPQGCQILGLDPLLFGLNHMPVKLALPAGLSPATRRFEAARSDALSYGSVSWSRRRDSHSRGAKARQFTKLLLSLLSHVGGENTLSLADRGALAPGAAARRSGLVVQTSSLFLQSWWAAAVPPRALRFKRPLHRCNACSPERDAKAELNRHSQACEVLADTGISRRV